MDKCLRHLHLRLLVSSISISRPWHASRGSLLKVSHACTSLRSKAGASEMLFGLLIVDDNFAALTVTAWLILGSPDNCEDVLCLLEDGIHFLKRAVSAFWIEEIDDWEDEGIATRVCQRRGLKEELRRLTSQRRLYVLYPIEENDTGVIMTTIKLKAQFALVDTALAGARIRRGTISAG